MLLVIKCNIKQVAISNLFLRLAASCLAEGIVLRVNFSPLGEKKGFFWFDSILKDKNCNFLSFIDVKSNTMSKYITVSEYAKQQKVTERTVYRWVKNGDVSSKKMKGVLHIKVGEEQAREDDIILTLKSENRHFKEEIEYLRGRLEQASETIDTIGERSDTIILQLTRQLESKQKQLEDLRDSSLWRRFKVALGFG